MSSLFVYLFHYGVSHVNVIQITHQIATEFPISTGVTRRFYLGESEIMQFLFFIKGLNMPLVRNKTYETFLKIM